MKKIIKILNLKLVIMLEYQNLKIFSQKAMFQIVLKILLVILTENNWLGIFTKNNCKSKSKKV